MNTIIRNKQIYKIEGIWRKNIDINIEIDLDINKVPFPYPNENKYKWEKKELLNKLYKIEEILIKKKNFKLVNYKKGSKCIFDNIKNINTKLFYINNNYWSDGLYHYIYYHNYKPSDEFINMILNIDIKKNIKTGKNILVNIPALTQIKHKRKYLKITKNQLMIMDALMKHGSSNKKYNDNDNKYKYSEHAGLIDFNDKGVESIIISGKTSRIDKNDDEIYLPENMLKTYEYEYIFHTHPATPYPGSRTKDGILFEFPSVNDILHFIEHYNNGKTQGSIVITPEGIYLIRKNIFDEKQITINNINKIYNKIHSYMDKLQENAIHKYGKINTYIYYSKIAQDTYYINKLNTLLNKYDIHIDYKPRIRNSKGVWILDTIFVPIFIK
jgi:hypothetical protein